MRFGVPERVEVEVVVYDAVGRLVCSLVRKSCEPGYYRVRWDGCDDLGRAVASGIYFVRFHAGNWTRTKKAILIR
ncbi:hypothetical protein BXT86_00515 [candidate division WOR-3 bacterium 4484_100]|uniref:FlgD/Vpr Ig-like domain-containing protein n=1 Tax=candidate division WOR-3 bacterium 4484_100 TaxID=1936077 RepID=A0A1V4QH60_UNCW3|nr:MAG: hypothetical protein BXT86_00515 [candidate division WOR-3 bacterium 4484_100]